MSNGTTLDTTAPTPNPPYFTTTPANDSDVQISMTSVTGSDTNTVNYYFTATSSGCTAGHNGTGGTDSGWQAGTSYSDAGLQANQCYGYLVTMKDDQGNYTSTSTASSTYTSAAVAGAPTFGTVNATTLVLSNTENGNPAANPTTDFAILASSTDGTWGGKYVDGSGNPSATPVWLTDAQIDNLTINGLTELTSYGFYSIARNADGDNAATSSQAATTTLDGTAPTPNPAYFQTVPTNDSTTDISMTSVTGTDVNTVNYYFTATSSGCTAGHNGTGADDSGWQVGASYIDTGLQTNKCYGYLVTMKDDLGNMGATSTASSTYTSAAVAGAPTFGTVNATTLVLSNTENGNPAANPTTDFAILASSTDGTWGGKYVDGSGNPSATPVWLTDAQIDNLTINGLTELTSYGFYSIARNADGDNAATSSQAATTTLDGTAPTPDPPTFSSSPANDSDTQISMTATAGSDASGPVEYYFTATSSGCTAGHNGTGGTDSGWQVGASYIDAGLQANKCYGYLITMRDAAHNYTATSSATVTYTSAAVASAPTLSGETGTTITLTNNENGNPSSNPTTDFAILASSTDGTWDQKYVDAAGDPSATPVWLTDAQIDGLVVTGLTDSTSYGFYSIARNADGDNAATSSQAVTSTTDITAPTPNPPYFATTPANDSDVQISMTSVTGTDVNTVNYYFTSDNTSCGSDAGTGGTNSGWQAGTSYSDAGLQPNQCYGYLVTMKDDQGNYTSTSTASTTYTSAAIPTAPTISSPGGTTLVITNNENGNPAANPTTYFAVYMASSSPSDTTWDGKYVDASGNPSGTAVWLTDAQLTSLTVNGLTQETTYSFESKARNQDNDETSFSAMSNGTTLDTTAPTPNPPTFSSAPANDSATQISMTATAGSDTSTPIEYYFTATSSGCAAGEGGTGGTDSGWQTSNSYSDAGLQANKCYGYLITMRDSALNYTATSSASATYTSANTPGAPTLSNATQSTLTITNDENSNPSSNPATSFAVHVQTTSPTDSTWDGKYVDASGDPSASAVWLTDAQIDNLTINGLTGETTYTFEVKARNADGDETSFGATANETTTPPPSQNVRLNGGIRLKGLRLW